MSLFSRSPDTFLIISKRNGKVINKPVYLCVGLNKDGLKEVLGMWVGKNESAAFWMGVLTDIKARGVEAQSVPCRLARRFPWRPEQMPGLRGRGFGNLFPWHRVLSTPLF